MQRSLQGISAVTQPALPVPCPGATHFTYTSEVKSSEDLEELIQCNPLAFHCWGIPGTSHQPRYSTANWSTVLTQHEHAFKLMQLQYNISPTSLTPHWDAVVTSLLTPPLLSSASMSASRATMSNTLA